MPQRLTLHQQQNPMLNAQLQVKYVFNLVLCILYVCFTHVCTHSLNEIIFTIKQVTGSVNNNSVRQNFINQPNPIGVLNTAGYNSDIPPSNNCPPQQVQQQFRLSRSINMTPANSQIPGK